MPAQLVFQGLLNEPGLVWWLPNFLFVLLVALGADYNIFLSGRIREEAERTDARDAVARGLSATGPRVRRTPRASRPTPRLALRRKR